MRERPLAQAGAGRQCRRRASSDGFDDLAVVDPLQVDGGDAEVRVTELSLDYVQRHAFAGHLDCVRVSELVRSETPAHTGLNGKAAKRRSRCGR
jgi:hypothetical protein